MSSFRAVQFVAPPAIPSYGRVLNVGRLNHVPAVSVHNNQLAILNETNDLLMQDNICTVCLHVSTFTCTATKRGSHNQD
jgi:hypothetical protein